MKLDPAVEIVWEDGFTRRHHGAFLFRRNVEHVRRVRRIIRQRYDHEVEVTFS